METSARNVEGLFTNNSLTKSPRSGRQQNREHGTFRNNPEHNSGIFRNIPEQGKLSQNKWKKKKESD